MHVMSAPSHQMVHRIHRADDAAFGWNQCCPRPAGAEFVCPVNPAPPVLSLLGTRPQHFPWSEVSEAGHSLHSRFQGNWRWGGLCFHSGTHHPGETGSPGKKSLQDCLLGRPHVWQESEPRARCSSGILAAHEVGARLLRNCKPQPESPRCYSPHWA